MKKYLFLILFFLLFQTSWAETKSKKNKVNLENNEKAEKDCKLIEEYIPTVKDNIQNITGTKIDIESVKLRPEGCAWNPDKGWHKPKS